MNKSIVLHFYGPRCSLHRDTEHEITVHAGTNIKNKITITLTSKKLHFNSNYNFVIFNYDKYTTKIQSKVSQEM